MDGFTSMYAKAITIAASLSILLVLAAARADARVELKSNGDQIEFLFEQAERREVLERLLTMDGATVTWADSAYADERISGQFRGTRGDVLLRLMRSTNFVLVYRDEGSTRRIVQIVVLGPQPGSTPAPSYRALAQAFGPPTDGAVTPEQKLAQLSREEIEQVAVSADEYAKRLEEQRLWGVNATNAHLDLLGRLAAQGLDLPQLRGVGDMSAGHAPGFMPPPVTDPQRLTQETLSLTQMMALRNLNALTRDMNALPGGR